MTNTNNNSEQWDEMVRVWEIAFRLAQSGQSKIIQSMQESYKRTGVNPTLDQMSKVDELWNAEKQARDAMDAFIAKCFH